VRYAALLILELLRDLTNVVFAGSEKLHNREPRLTRQRPKELAMNSEAQESSCLEYDIQNI
jgi:hypothetical protein